MSSILTRDVRMTGVPKDKVEHIKTGLEQQGYQVVVIEEAGGTFTIIGIMETQGS